MFTGNLPAQSRSADYIETIEITDEDAPHDLVDLSDVTAATVGLACFGEDDTALVSKTLDDGVTLESDGILQWWFVPTDFTDLCPGSYRLTVDVTVDPSGQVVRLVDALLPLI